MQKIQLDKMHQDLKQHVMMRVMMEHIYSHYSLELNSGEFWSFILLQRGGIVLICSVYHRTRDTTERTKCCIWWWNPIPYFKGSFSGLIASFSWQYRAHFESCLEKWNRTFRVFLKPAAIPKHREPPPACSAQFSQSYFSARGLRVNMTRIEHSIRITLVMT